MGYFEEYLTKQLSFAELTAARKAQLKRISSIRGRDILVWASDITKGNLPNGIGYEDILPLSDQLANLKGKKLDLIVETPGGSAEVVDEIVQLIRKKYSDLAVIVPGWAKSAGTILAMAADDILMGPTSALGPIDAQFFWQAKRFSAGELLDGMEKIKSEVATSGVLNKAYIPILQGISPGELQRAENAQEFSKKLVTEWLIKYKFKDWRTHSSTGKTVTEQERLDRADEIATELRDHTKWLTHGKSIKIDDLRGMKLQIEDYSENPALFEAIRRYHVLLQMTFSANIFKIMETVDSQVYKHVPQLAPGAPQNVQPGSIAEVEIACGNCKAVTKVQANLGQKAPLKQGNLPFPSNNVFRCPSCGIETILADLRRQIEMQARQPIIVQ